jgi:hypothetical protein
LAKDLCLVELGSGCSSFTSSCDLVELPASFKASYQNWLNKDIIKDFRFADLFAESTGKYFLNLLIGSHATPIVII